MYVTEYIIRKGLGLFALISCFADFYFSLAISYNQLWGFFQLHYKLIRKHTHILSFLAINFLGKLSLIGPFQGHIINQTICLGSRYRRGVVSKMCYLLHNRIVDRWLKRLWSSIYSSFPCRFDFGNEGPWLEKSLKFRGLKTKDLWALWDSSVFSTITAWCY